MGKSLGGRLEGNPFGTKPFLSESFPSLLSVHLFPLICCSPNKARISAAAQSLRRVGIVALIQRACGERTTMMTRDELEKWLGDRSAKSVALGEIAEILHVVLEASRRSLALADAAELQELRFAVAVLRDIFPNDAGVRAWLRAPARDISGLTPADLLSGGRINEFADLAVAEWNRPRGVGTPWHRAMLAPA
jgi:hypothetical protein